MGQVLEDALSAVVQAPYRDMTLLFYLRIGPSTQRPLDAVVDPVRQALKGQREVHAGRFVIPLRVRCTLSKILQVSGFQHRRQRCEYPTIIDVDADAEAFVAKFGNYWNELLGCAEQISRLAAVSKRTRLAEQHPKTMDPRSLDAPEDASFEEELVPPVTISGDLLPLRRLVRRRYASAPAVAHVRVHEWRILAVREHSKTSMLVHLTDGLHDLVEGFKVAGRSHSTVLRPSLQLRHRRKRVIPSHGGLRRPKLGSRSAHWRSEKHVSGCQREAVEN